ncbi:hypothetical protein BH09VER1_BH09VER1_48920 [soil metagenome]
MKKDGETIQPNGKHVFRLLWGMAVCCAFFQAGAEEAGQAKAQPSVSPIHFERELGVLKQEVKDAEGETGRDLLCEVANNANSTAAMKLAAVSLLGEYRDAKSVEAILANISLSTEPSRRPPAVSSLRKIGELAVPDILKRLETANEETGRYLVAALIEIKGREKVGPWITENQARFTPHQNWALRAYCGTIF